MAYGDQIGRLRKYVAERPHRTRREIVHGAGVAESVIDAACSNGVLSRHGKRGESTYTLAENGLSARKAAPAKVAPAKVAAASSPLPPKPNAATASALTHLQAARNELAAEVTAMQRKITAIDAAIAALK